MHAPCVQTLVVCNLRLQILARRWLHASGMRVPLVARGGFVYLNTIEIDKLVHKQLPQGESLQCALLLDYVPPEEPLGTPLGNTLRIRRPKLDWRGP